MANLMRCPNCGKNTPAELEFCQYCQSRLEPEDVNPPLTPGQAPTRKITSDLEQVLPQWLQDARQAARDTSQDGSPQLGNNSQIAPSTFSGSDLLSGLQSQSQDDDEDEIPDWLANITGQAPKPKKPQATSDVRWVEFGGSKDFTQPVPKPEPEPEPPAWMSTPPAAEENDELTDWLRATDAAQPQQPQTPSFGAPVSSDTPDWLHSMVSEGETVFNDAGSLSSEEKFSSDDAPDWLRGLDAADASGGSTAAPVFSDTADWLKQLDAEDAAPQSGFEPAASDTPDWLKAMDAQSAPQSGFEPAASDTPDWLKAMDAQSAPQPGFESAASDTPDWLKAMDAQSAPQSGFESAASDTPDWLKAMDAQAAPQPGFESAASDTPDWLKAMDAQAAPQPGFESAASDTPDWLKAMDAQSAPRPGFESAASDTPDWLKAMSGDQTSQGDDFSPFAGADLSEAPTVLEPKQEDWLAGFQSSAEPPAVPPAPDDDGDLPGWLKAAAPQPAFADTPEAISPASAESPDWLNALQSQPVEPEPTPPAAASGADSESLFTDLPDWLSVVDETAVSSEAMPAPITNTDAIAPGELPTWVQAMRPVDAGIPQTMASLSADRTLETRGALAGLQGVLPAAPNYAPTSKPKAHSIRLQASEEQLSHAALLEQILSAETSPVPISSFASLGTSRALRWTLAILLFALLTIVLVMRIEVFPLPDSVNVPLEVNGAVTAVQSIPENVPILAIFDYEPSRAVEVESAAVPVLDQLLMKRARLTFVSTTEAGAVLAQRLVTKGYLSGHENLEYANLGYLSGGQMGIRAFADNPLAIAPYAFVQNQAFDYAPVPAWDKPALQGVTSLPQFAAILLITDDADSARAWIEQTQSSRGNPSIPLVVISSAQAAPMLQPYFASGQTSGMISGLYGGALFERRNNNNPGNAIAAWDAYSVGILLAIVLILGGGLLNLVLGLRDHAATREEK
jgi:hypothetical protein